MANKVVIDTEINAEPVTRGINEIQKDMDRVAAAQQKLQERFNKFEFMGGDKASKTFQSMRYDADRLNTTMFDLEEEMSKALSAGSGKGNDKAREIENVKKASERASVSVKKLGTSTKSLTKSFADGIKSMLKYVFGIATLMALFNKLRNALTEGFKNLAQFNDGVNPTNTAISNLQSALLQLKNSFATAFSPILTVIEPVLTRLINMISTAVTYVGMLIAALTGATSFTRATSVQQNYAKSLNKTAKAAKEANKQLSGLDELNVLNQNENEEADAGGGAGGVNPNQMFENVEIPSGILALAEKLKKIIEPFKESLRNWFNDLDFQPLIDSFMRLRDAVMPLVDKLGSGLLWFLENVIEPIGTFVIEEGLPKFFDMLASAATLLNKALDVLKPTFDYVWQNILKPMGEFVGEAILWFLETLEDLFNEVTKVFDKNGDDINNVLIGISKASEIMWLATKKILQFLMGAIKTLLVYLVDVAGDVIVIFSGITDFLSGVFSKDWDKALSGLVKIAKGIFNGIVDIFEGVVNAIIDGLNNIDIDIPDWVPVIGGSNFGFQLERLHIPRLATGTVVPRQSREFMAVLGDNNREAEVVSPLSTMKQAMLEALNEYTPNSDDRDIVINIDGREVFRVVRKQSKSYKRTTGRPAFE